mmetsp:Transcript_34380/g.75258  ORF Transcript_34380/g.75258 Transcript_34380/m.75258 type:complete len:202 (-) Transcript_34380:807-1412(-)
MIAMVHLTNTAVCTLHEASCRWKKVESRLESIKQGRIRRPEICQPSRGRNISSASFFLAQSSQIFLHYILRKTKLPIPMRHIFALIGEPSIPNPLTFGAGRRTDTAQTLLRRRCHCLTARQEWPEGSPSLCQDDSLPETASAPTTEATSSSPVRCTPHRCRHTLAPSSSWHHPRPPSTPCMQRSSKILRPVAPWPSPRTER